MINKIVNKLGRNIGNNLIKLWKEELSVREMMKFNLLIRKLRKLKRKVKNPKEKVRKLLHQLIKKKKRKIKIRV